MPSVWIIHRAWPVADLSSLPPVVRAAIDADDSFLGFYYILGSHHQSEYSGAGPIEYWTLCWDSNINVQWSYYSPHYSTRARHVFVRVDHDGPPPIASGMDASWEDAQVHVRKLILITARNLCHWFKDERSLGPTRRRRLKSSLRYLQRVIARDIWRRCFWCYVLAENPYIVERSMGPLCNLCYDRWVAGGGPHKLTALQRRQNGFQIFLRPTVCANIASFLSDWREPLIW